MLLHDVAIIDQRASPILKAPLLSCRAAAPLPPPSARHRAMPRAVSSRCPLRQRGRNKARPEIGRLSLDELPRARADESPDVNAVWQSARRNGNGRAQAGLRVLSNRS